MLRFFIMVSMQIFFTALADRTRRRILNLIRQQEMCVHFFTEILEISQPKISRHLAYLRKAEIVTTRREGKLIYYRITPPDDFYARQILQDTLEWLADDERMQIDYENLLRVYESLDAPRTDLQNAVPDISRQSNMNSARNQEIETYLL